MTDDNKASGAEASGGKRGITRRDLLKAGAVAGAAGVVAGPAGVAAAVVQEPAPPGMPDVILTRGKIHTFDAGNSIVSSVAIKDGKFVAIGRDGRGGPQSRVIDLRGRTVVPGLIEGHIHVVSLANRPGYHVLIEDAPDIAGIQEILASRRPGVPEGEFITSMGGWHTNMFAERRLPTLAELDAAVPDRPVMLYSGGGSGPAVVNSLGKAYFDAIDAGDLPHPDAGKVNAGADGLIASGLPGRTALYILRSEQTFEDKKRSTRDAMAESARLGLTALLDQVLPPAPGPINPGQSLSGLDHFRMYDSWLAVHADGDTTVRLQMNFLHNQNDVNLPELKERLKNQFPLFGDDMLRTGAIGEWGAPGDGSGAAWTEAQRVIAQARWRNTNRTFTLAGLENITAGYEAVDAEFGIRDLRWTVHHINVANEGLLERLKAMNVGVQTGSWRYTSGTAANNGSPFRMVVDNGIQAGIHMDGVHIAPMSPWPSIYYACTGVNALGVLINDGQQITRQEAMRLYTKENAWHLNMEDRLGTIEPGRLADLVVLDKDYTTCSDEELLRMKPVMTIVDGKVVHDTGVLG